MREITLEDVPEKGPLYVKSAAGIGRQAGDLNIDIQTDASSGKRHLITIPKTFIPLKISDLAPVKAIINSISFRKAYASRILRIIHPEDAELELRKPEGRAELERVRQMLFSGIDFDKVDTGMSAIEAIAEAQSDSVNVIVKDILLRSDIEDEEKLALLRAEEPELQKVDYDYIISTTEDTSNINKWSKDRLANSQGMFK